MRIISGALKGRLIKFLKNSKTRPIKDKVRESIFNIIQHSKKIEIKIEGSKVLDLYSGIGSFGIECLSRGAKKVNFIEQDISAINILKDNLINLSIISKSRIFLDKIENVFSGKTDEKFNVIFLDPPFSDSCFIENLKIIKKEKIYHKDHLIIIHREIKSKDRLEDLLNLIDIKKYGRSKIIFSVFK